MALAFAQLRPVRRQSRRRRDGVASQASWTSPRAKSSSWRGVTVCVLRPARRRAASSAAQSERVGDAGAPRRRVDRRSPPFSAGVGERDEMSGEVAAVDGGHIFGIERAEIARVVPIVEMAAKARHASHRRERRFQPVDGLGRADPTEIPGADDGKQIEADVGRRGSVGDAGRGVFLEIVRRQHVVGRRHERFEDSARCGARSAAAPVIRRRRLPRAVRAPAAG